MGKRVDKKAMSLGALYQEKWGGVGRESGGICRRK